MISIMFTNESITAPSNQSGSYVRDDGSGGILFRFSSLARGSLLEKALEALEEVAGKDPQPGELEVQG
jgi:hypothetical protein